MNPLHRLIVIGSAFGCNLGSHLVQLLGRTAPADNRTPDLTPNEQQALAAAQARRERRAAKLRKLHGQD